MTLPSPTLRLYATSSFIALGLLLACDGNSGPDALASCQPGVTIKVSAGTTPTFSWTPRCRAAEIIVDPNSDFFGMWAVKAAGDTDALAPPLQYGTHPPNSVTLQAALLLQAGTTYRVLLARATGDTTMPIEVVASTFFVP